MSEVHTRDVCAVVVNWNGWRDTVGCVASLLALEEPPGLVVVCENGSTDGSATQLRDALVGSEGVHLLVLPQNLGYAGGLNAGVAWARRHTQARWFWLLNNDLCALPGALRALLDAHRQVPDAGLVGSVLLEWDTPSPVQAVGGRYLKWLGVGVHAKEAPDARDDVSLAMDYPVGASLLVSAAYLDRVGPMEDGYFLYYEEIDWVERGRRHGLRPVIALRSRLRHKEGASTGSQGGVRNKSLLSEHHGVVNRLRVTRKFWPQYLPIVWASLFAVAGDRVLHGEFSRAALVLRLMFSPRLWLR
ncbi:glycosyltransferase family 2 protein [Ramlibacter sp. USB13]|uniref:Glycosyltransferase family 2 protein n=1 Tax=Ramlibacter cellulosilyticus TaxID=2764187 RepID=A0A923MPZ4_9BURK|nr:glycosyltransferase family 2 protein [Ramlibacter cellulosilyticus]MBC5782796.1 glycosyltransferase family 2 protein [Ramlibacter cellulosilyticus]